VDVYDERHKEAVNATLQDHMLRLRLAAARRDDQLVISLSMRVQKTDLADDKTGEERRM
jgi:hypothetical protein